MVVLITPQTADRHADILDQVYRLRHRVFADRLGWVPPRADGREIDAFDKGDWIHFASLDPEGRVDGCWRLLPTTGPYMAEKVFPDLFCGREIPHAAKIWEVSRFAVEPTENSERIGVMPLAALKLFMALLEFAAAHDIREMLSVQDILLTRWGKMIGPPPLWHEKIHKIGKTRTHLVNYGTTPDTLMVLRDRFELPAPVLSYFTLNDRIAA